MGKSYKQGSAFTHASFGSWQTRIEELSKARMKIVNDHAFKTISRKKQPKLLHTLMPELPNAIIFQRIPRDVSARIHAYHVAKALVENKKLLEDKTLLSQAEEHLNTSAEAQLPNGTTITIRGKPVNLVDAHLPQAQIQSYSGFINQAKRALQISLFRAGEKVEEKFNYSRLIDFASKGQLDTLKSGLGPLFSSIRSATRIELMRPEERMLNRDVELVELKERIEELFNRVENEKRGEYGRRKRFFKEALKVNALDYIKIFNLMEKFEESARSEGDITKTEAQLIKDFRKLKSRMAFSEVKTNVS
jgi:hypothetical protein